LSTVFYVAEPALTPAQAKPEDTQSPPQTITTHTDDDWVLLSKEEVLHTLPVQHCACGVPSPAAESMEASWYVTPPACFTDSSSNMSECKPSSMENLLLEHPSMSVYHKRERRSSTGSSRSSSSPQRDPSPAQAAAAPAPVERVQPTAAHVINKHMTTSQLQSIKSTKAATKHSNRNVHYKQMSRGNKIREVPCHGKSRRHLIAARYSGVCNDRRRC
jgi:hypothetical protein